MAYICVSCSSAEHECCIYDFCECSTCNSLHLLDIGGEG